MNQPGASTGSVLSDVTIKDSIGTLLDGGKAENAKSAAYEFLPGKLYPTGQASKGQPVDWTQPNLPSETLYPMKPGELLMVRTRECVTMPTNLCGLWLQLDRNSRKGLLLVNQTIVPPGYKGFLTCTFVNFSNETIALRPSSPVARMVFLKLDQDASNHGKPLSADEYDQLMSEAALKAPSTFLAIAERSAELAKIVEDGKQTLDRQKADLVEQSTKDLQRAAEDAKTTFQTDLKGASKTIAPWAIGLILLVTVGQTAANWIGTKLSPDLDKIANARAAEVEKKIDDQLKLLGDKRVFVYSGTAEAKAMADRIEDLEKQIAAMKTRR
jgi:dUTPase/polyhydroxyalkanoate synthesis regulator phasin